MVMVFGCPVLMFGSVCVKWKTFEFSKGGGGAFAFSVIGFSRRKKFFVMLSLEEFHWLAVN